MKLNIVKSVTIITPTIGSAKLHKAFQSVQEQTYENIKHMIVIDGPEHIMDLQALQLPREVKKDIILTCAPINTGANNFYGHRVYSAYPHMVNTDYVMFLDEDNWFKPDHVQSLVDTIESGEYDWVHSLRSIYAPDGSFLVDDNCESLGKYPIYGDLKNGQLVDTSSYLFKTEWLIRTSQFWHDRWGADRNFLNIVKNLSKWESSGKHTLCYRLDGNPNSPKVEFFQQGNEIAKKIYNDTYPWNKV